MALNIKDPETERLAAELATWLSTTKTGAIRDAHRTRLAALGDPTAHRNPALAPSMRCGERPGGERRVNASRAVHDPLSCCLDLSSGERPDLR
jgi:hypothetical protein